MLIDLRDDALLQPDEQVVEEDLPITETHNDKRAKHKREMIKDYLVRINSFIPYSISSDTQGCLSSQSLNFQWTGSIFPTPLEYAFYLSLEVEFRLF